MIKIVSIEHMRRIEAAADASGLSYDTMMEQAGRAAALRAIDMLNTIQAQSPKVLLLIGTGNNGGDGLVAARSIAQETSASVNCYLLKHRSDDNFQKAVEANVTMASAEDDSDGSILTRVTSEANIIVDALFGIGVRIPIKGHATKILNAVKTVVDERKQHLPDQIIFADEPAKPHSERIPVVLAIDCPSGVDCDTGKIDVNTLPADETITFIAAKPGLLMPPALEAVGTLSIATIGVSPVLPEIQEANWHLATALDVKTRLPRRAPNSHKGTYGKTMIVAGSTNYFGAPRLAAEGAYRSGTGLVTVGSSSPVVQVLASSLAESTWVMLPHDMGVISEKATSLVVDQLDGYQSLLLGPGLAQEETTGEFIKQLLNSPTQLKQHAKEKRNIGFSHIKIKDKQVNDPSITLPPLVIDADGLNLLSKIENWWELLPNNTILTPHPGEMSRLTGLSTAEINQNRWKIAIRKASEWNVILLLKGAHTLIANPEGELHVLPFKIDALATAGSGDVLAGLIAGLLAQGLSSYDAAIVGGYVHGLSGKLAQESVGHGSGRGVIAGDILQEIPQALALIEKGF